MKTIVLLFIAISFSSFSQSKIKIKSPNGKQNTVKSIVKSLEGEGIIIQNITSNQTDTTNQLGTFYDKKYSLSMKKGILMTTGSVKTIVQKNTFTGMTGTTSGTAKAVFQNNNHSNKKTKQVDVINTVLKNISNEKIGDDDLSKELGDRYSLYDACVVEMDVIPLGDTLNFRYLFASEEYDEYVCSEFNDAFAFFISGPGISNKKNMAVLKSGARISINSINNGNPSNPDCEKSNPSFYKKNDGNIALEYDGFTRTLEIIQPVKAFNTYHLKMVIADANDGIYDSGVFIESKSIITYNKKYVVPFESDKFNLTQKTKSILNAMMEITENHPEYKVEISGHTDSDGSERYNLSLSQSRMNHVINYITDQGFDSGNIIKINKGESMPIATNETEIGKQRNRRVEIKLIPSISDPIASDNIKTLPTEVVIENINPNPSRTVATINIKNLPDASNNKILIHNMAGTLIKELIITQSKTKINVEGWETGIYNATLITSNNIKSSKKFVVIK